MATSQVATTRVRELTVRGIVLGGVITLVFTAANVYLGLKVGLTFATSIPAAVISMAVLRKVRDSSIQENNIVQTITSSAGTLAAIIFVLPGLIIVGWWQGFPYWTTLFICIIGGALGVMYTVPLRRALVTGSDLPYPEGVAAAEVLQVGSRPGVTSLEPDPAAASSPEPGAAGNKEGVRAILWGGVAAAVFGILTKLKILSDSLFVAARVGTTALAGSASLSLALIGIGHLVGLSVGIAMFVGLAIGWGALVPIFAAGHIGAAAGVAGAVNAVFSSDVRFVGAGAMAIAAVWALVKIIGPIAGGIRDAVAAARERRAGRVVALTERDIPIGVVGGWILASLVPIGIMLWLFLRQTRLGSHPAGTLAMTLVFTVLIGAVVAAVCGYMAGLIGSSNSPISGVGILVVLLLSLAMVIMHGAGGSPRRVTEMVAYTIFATAIIFAIATISNDNLQDLKTGQLVGATPWKQQVALVIGVVFGSLLIAPILDLLNSAFGFVGAPGAGPDALPAPQAGLITALAQGVFGGKLDWGLVGLGVLIGAAVIVVDEILARTATGARVPPLAVGMGIYLPMSLTLVIAVGALVGRWHDRWASRQRDPKRAHRLGILMATGLIVGDSLWGVTYAGIVVGSGKPEPLGLVGSGFAPWATGLGVVAFLAVIAGMYRMVRRFAASPDRAAGEGTSTAAR